MAAELLPEDGLADGGITEDFGEEGTVEDRPPAVEQLVPSSFGLTFALDASVRRASCDGLVGCLRAADERASARPRREAGARVAATGMRRRTDDRVSAGRERLGR